MYNSIWVMLHKFSVFSMFLNRLLLDFASRVCAGAPGAPRPSGRMAVSPCPCPRGHRRVGVLPPHHSCTCCLPFSFTEPKSTCWWKTTQHVARSAAAHPAPQRWHPSCPTSKMLQHGLGSPGAAPAHPHTPVSFGDPANHEPNPGAVH